MIPSIDHTQIFGRFIPLKSDRGKFNILTYEPEYSICVKRFNTK